jgi:hypothetical protein
MARRSERRADRGERRGLRVVAAHVGQPLRELLERSRVDPAAVGLDALACAIVDAVRILRIAAHGHHGHVEPSALHHPL